MQGNTADCGGGPDGNQIAVGERWKYEIVQFKEAKGGYDTDKTGSYFSAVSNEASARHI